MMEDVVAAIFLAEAGARVAANFKIKSTLGDKTVAVYGEEIRDLGQEAIMLMCEPFNIEPTVLNEPFTLGFANQGAISVFSTDEKIEGYYDSTLQLMIEAKLKIKNED
jgi:hypothetical protein